MVTFEEALERLAQLPRMFIEPDGSLVWAGELEDGRKWQVDGNLIDQGEKLGYVELKGCCPEQRFDEILRTLGWPVERLEFQLVRTGAAVNEGEFKRRAGSSEGAQ